METVNQHIQLEYQKYMLNVWCFESVLSSAEIYGKFVKLDTFQASTKSSDNSLCSMQLFVGLIIIIFVDILKVGSIGKTIW